jgi:tRNA modification GTPase
VLNKIDLLEPSEWAAVQSPFPDLQARSLPVSALTGEGLEALEGAIVETVFSGQTMASEAPLVTSPRHKEALNQALEHVEVAYSAHCAGISADLVSIDLTAAVNVLGEITGQTASDDLVEKIFCNFCVGK